MTGDQIVDLFLSLVGQTDNNTKDEFMKKVLEKGTFIPFWNENVDIFQTIDLLSAPRFKTSQELELNLLDAASLTTDSSEFWENVFQGPSEGRYDETESEKTWPSNN